MYDKETCRTSLNNLKKYVKLSQFADEFGIPRTTLSMFMRGSEFDYQISSKRINDFIVYIDSKLKILT